MGLGDRSGFEYTGVAHVKKLVDNSKSIAHPDPKFRADPSMKLYRALVEKSEEERNSQRKSMGMEADLVADRNQLAKAS